MKKTFVLAIVLLTAPVVCYGSISDEVKGWVYNKIDQCEETPKKLSCKYFWETIRKLIDNGCPVTGNLDTAPEKETQEPDSNLQEELLENLTDEKIEEMLQKSTEASQNNNK